MLTILLRASLIRSSGIGAFPIKSARVDLEACRKGVSERDPALKPIQTLARSIPSDTDLS